ncbi:hypothetical protein CKAN_01697000 [Cinnamomum micranthum f. kanehirae]|uniref:Uncharacterized protein n=1 Tax=Cinnamomum micranthum f. kanehirae TaxID=337451 RepID=A0A3S3MQR3_9MAGN|nr:hypothetical protein CKAN_01697000 [Cinnamomum micranthum f. kanehirae]
MIFGEEQDAGKEDEELVNEPKEAPLLLEDRGQATIDELVEIKLGSPEEPKITYVSKSLSNSEMKEYVAYLSDYKDVFGWSYKEMPGLDLKVATHKLAVDPSKRPVKQAQRRFHSDLAAKIELEIYKLQATNFIHEVKYPT